jgi:transcriptional regulator with XRE-family HTH domain
MSRPEVSRELAAFLRTRRERLSPEQAQLPSGRARARRTPGLRREEVAQLASVSVDYVVRLEQGRGLNPSPEVLESLARALRLTPDERAYLFELSGRARPEAPVESGETSPLARLVTDLSPLPAMLVDHCFDILAWNPEMAGLIGDFGAIPAERRNTIDLCLLSSELDGFYVDREQLIREGIADLRAAWVGNPEDTRLAARIERWRGRSPEFDQLWEQRDVRVNGRGCKRLRHPEVGPLSVDYEVLLPLADVRHRLIVYRASDPASQQALDRIAARCRVPVGA